MRNISITITRSPISVAPAAKKPKGEELPWIDTKSGRIQALVPQPDGFVMPLALEHDMHLEFKRPQKFDF